MFRNSGGFFGESLKGLSWIIFKGESALERAKWIIQGWFIKRIVQDYPWIIPGLSWEDPLKNHPVDSPGESRDSPFKKPAKDYPFRSEVSGFSLDSPG
jgi:hypothetical protein